MTVVIVARVGSWPPSMEYRIRLDFKRWVLSWRQRYLLRRLYYGGGAREDHRQAYIRGTAGVSQVVIRIW